MMKKIDLGQTITVLANLGVIAGIVFLAVEIQQNNEALGVQARMERQAARRAISTRAVDNPELARAMRKAQQGELLTPDEAFVLEHEIMFRIINWEIVFTDVQEGLLSEQAIPLQGWRDAYHRRFPGMPAVWAQMKNTGVPTEFAEFVDAEIVPTRNSR